jgi:flavorubredoxin
MNTRIYGAGVSRVGVRQITPKLYWISHCIGEHAARHNGGFAADFARDNPKLDPEANDIIYNSYLFLDEQTFLMDTLAPAQHDTVLQALDDLLAGRKLDYLWISHTELPHAGNAEAIRRAHRDVQLLTVGGHDHYEIHGFGDARLLNYGDKLHIGEHVLEIIEPLFLDHALTQWVYEHTTGFMCPVDWALNLHNHHQCFRFMDEMEAVGYSPERFMEDVATTNRTVFSWLRWANPDETVAAIDRFLDTYDIRIFAPSHAQVIRTEVPKYMAALRQAMHMAVSGRYDLVF